MREKLGIVYWGIKIIPVCPNESPLGLVGDKIGRWGSQTIKECSFVSSVAGML